MNSVGENVGDWEIDTRIILVGYFVEDEVGGQNFADIVRFAGVVEDS